MNSINKKFKSAIESIRLTDVEKGKLGARIISEMSQYSFPEIVGDTSVRNPELARHQYSRTRLSKNKLIKNMPIAILIGLLMSGGVSYASTNALPGDVLYPVKIHVNEKIESALTVGQADTARLEVKFALRRLAEVEKLQAEHKLDAKTKTELKANFDSHTAKLEVKLGKIGKESNSDATKISSDFETSLRGHANALLFLGINANEDSNDTRTASSTALEQKKEHTVTSSRGDAEVGAHYGHILKEIFRANDTEKMDNNVHVNEEHPSSLKADNGMSNDNESPHSSTSASGTVQTEGVLDVHTDTHTDGELKNEHTDSASELNANIRSEGKLQVGL